MTVKVSFLPMMENRLHDVERLVKRCDRDCFGAKSDILQKIVEHGLVPVSQLDVLGHRRHGKSA